MSVARASMFLLALSIAACSKAPVDVPDSSTLDAAPDLAIQPDLADALDVVPTADVAADLKADAGVDVGIPAGPWRSALYPDDWQAAATDPDGRYIPDFSWAGYRHGEEPGAVVLTEFNVGDFGADPTTAADSQPAFQAALDAASVAGGIVVVPEGLYRIDEQLLVTASNVVLRGAGASRSRLWFTRSAGMSNRSHLTFRGPVTTVSEHLLTSDGPERSQFLDVDSASFSIGEDVVVGWNISPEFVEEHQMTGTWIAFNDTWQPFFRRQVTATSNNRVEVDVPLRYAAKMRDGASIRREAGYLENVGVEGIGIADAVDWTQAWSEVQVHVIELDGVADSWVVGVESFPSPGAPVQGEGAGAHLQNGGVMIRGSKRVTVADSRLELAQNRGGGGCGYLFEVRQSSEVLFRDLEARAGRHNFIQNWGFGTSGIVWLRVHSSEGRTFLEPGASISGTGDSEFHHSLAMSNLIDSSTVDDGFSALNRKGESTGAGHTSTQTVFWNSRGSGRLRSYQYGHGYIIGTSAEMTVLTDMPTDDPELRAQLEDVGPWTATWPVDWLEGRGRAADLEPRSLYEDQRARRIP